MKLCQTCGQILAEEITTCPSCGSEVAEGRRMIDDYRILEVLHEGYASILCRAEHESTAETVMIRLFTPRANIDDTLADRLKKELEELKKLPEDYFVRHYEFRRSTEGLWYRVSEWIDVESWTDLIAEGFFQDHQAVLRLFSRIASILEGLHRIGHIIPHLILHDIIPYRKAGEDLQIKIDYKLSRFLDPKLDRPGPMLEKLLNRHPDIINNRPLDARSDIWSLGKVFVELLTADMERYNYSEMIDDLMLPHEFGVHLKLMLSEDPGLRPRSMAQVAETLNQIKDKSPKKRDQESGYPFPVQEIRGLKKWVRLLVVIIILVGTVGLIIWVYGALKKDNGEATLLNYANKYAPSVAFVLVEYGLVNNGETYYRRRTEGTAFLADSDGYLLTNRHVACPWLEDTTLINLISHLKLQNMPVEFQYRAYAWFEGQQAFKRLPKMSEVEDLEDVYYLENAFSSVGKLRLSILGVGKVPKTSRQQIRSPLGDDFAVLQIQPVPAKLKPLPIDRRMDPLMIPKLLPVLTLGFPLGSQTQAANVNVSVTTGHVRRAFDNFLQVDTSLYRGNSGGPIIDINGKVIGIASSVAVDWARSPMPVATPLSDMGMVLPIGKAVSFLNEIKSGKIKWNGILDLSASNKIEQVKKLAAQKKWAEAQTLSDQALHGNSNPALIMAAAMMHFCNGDQQGAGRLFDRAVSIDSENGIARFMLFIIDWLNGRADTNPYYQEFLNLDWRSSNEFFGYLVRVLTGAANEDIALRGAANAAKKSWLYYTVGLKRQNRMQWVQAESLIRKAARLPDEDKWIYYLSQAAWQWIQKQRLSLFDESKERATYLAEIKKTERLMQKEHLIIEEKSKKLTRLAKRLAHPDMNLDNRRQLLSQMHEIEPDNTEILAGLIFVDIMSGTWKRALKQIKDYLRTPGHESRSRLSIGLMEPIVLRMLGKDDQSKAELDKYVEKTMDPWFLSIARCLSGDIAVDHLIAKAAPEPAYILTANAALGLWAEGGAKPELAIGHYREALGSYMDEYPEYELSLERIKHLRSRSARIDD
jgi:tetratricopeptide (TPR) repeat protein